MQKKINTITKVVMAFLIVSALASTVFAWQAPVVSSKCAPDASTRTFSITLNPEVDQIIELSYDNFTTIEDTRDFVTDGTHNFTLPANGTTLSARYQLDPGAQGSTAVNTTLCTPPSTGGGHGTQTSSGSMLYPCHYFPNAIPTCQTTPYQWQQWNNPYSKERIMNEWRCRTFGVEYCPKTQSPTIKTPAEIYGK